MKTEKSLQKSARHCLNRATKNAEELHKYLLKHKEGFRADTMPAIRNMVQDIAQDVHEYNAYSNSLLTD